MNSGLQRASQLANNVSDLSGSGSPIFPVGSPAATIAVPLEDNLPSNVNEKHDKDSVLTSDNHKCLNRCASHHDFSASRGCVKSDVMKTEHRINLMP
jgi:hypothetical protein